MAGVAVRCPREKGQAGIIGGDGEPVIDVELPCNRPHPGVAPPPLDIIGKLSDEIPLVQARKPGRKITVAFAVEAVAGGAGGLCPGIAP